MTRRRLQGLQVEDVTSYLGSHGWLRKSDFPRSDVHVFLGHADDDGEQLEIVLPARTNDASFQPALERVVATLSIVEERSVSEIAAEMRSPDADRISLRLISGLAKRGSIPLNLAYSLVGSLRDLMVAAACVEEQPRGFFAKATKAGTSFADACRFGQTDVGSFVANVETTVPPVFVSGSTPFQRRVTQRIIRGFADIEQAVVDGKPDALLSEKTYQTGVNANMCEALLRLRKEEPEMELEFAATFSRTVPADATLLKMRAVRLGSRAFDLMEGAARSMRGAQESVPRTLSGVIVRLADATDDDDESDIGANDEDRSVVLRFEEAGRRQHARFHLEQEQYRLACDAHRDRKRVEVTGNLERIGKQWRLQSVSAFRLVSGPVPE